MTPMRNGLAILLLMYVATWSPAASLAQESGLKERIVGTWAYEAVDLVQPDGTRRPMYGMHPHGIAMFDASGHYMLLTARADMAKFAVNNRLAGTAEEYKAVVQGSIAHFGRYEVNEATKTIIFHIETSTFPNWNATDQQRPVRVTESELKWTTPASSGGTAEVVLKRINTTH